MPVLFATKEDKRECFIRVGLTSVHKKCKILRMSIALENIKTIIQFNTILIQSNSKTDKIFRIYLTKLTKI